MNSDEVADVLRGPVPWLVFGVLVVLAVVRLLRPVFGALVAGLFVYYASRPVYRWLLPHVTHPDVAVGVTLAAYTLPFLAIFGYALWIVVHQLGQILSPALLADVNRILGTSFEPGLLSNPMRIFKNAFSGPGQPNGGGGANVPSGAKASLKNFLQVLVYVGLRLFLLITFAFYFLRDDAKLAGWAERTFGEDSTVVEYLRAVDHQLGTIYFGNVVTIAATAIIAVATFKVLGLLAPGGGGIVRPVLVGLLVGAATIVPVVGMKIVWIPYNAYLALVAMRSPAVPMWFPVVFLVVTFLVVDSFPDVIIRSYASARETHMGLVMIAYVVGTITFGWYGLFLGPIVLVAAVQFGRHIFPRFVDDGGADAVDAS